MKICFTGDSIALRLPADSYWQDNSLHNQILDCDIRGTNLEMVVSGGNAFASTFCGGYWITSDEEKLDCLSKFGFQHYSIANNHTMDYSYKGLSQTIDKLDARGLLHSGAGNSLEEATSASFLTKDGFSIAFISCTASCDDAARAGKASSTIPARPGVNMLRHSEILYLTDEYLRIIDEIAQATCVNARFDKSVRMGIHTLQPGIHRLGRLQFVKGIENKKTTYCHCGDLERISNEVKAARRTADFVAVGIHSHDIKGMTDDSADYYLEEFAHKCIDSGASVIVGTGTHQLKGIEIYKNSPIFYSLGNFIFASEHLDYAPADYYERYNVDTTASINNVWLKRSKNNTVGLEFDQANYRSIVPILHIEKGGLSRIELLPIELGFHSACIEKGFPHIADAIETEAIFDRLEYLCEQYRTRIDLSEKGIIRVLL